MKTRNEKIRLAISGSILIMLIAIALLNNACGKNKADLEEKVPAVPAPPVAVDSIAALPEPYSVVDEMPVFPGGDAALLDYIAKNVKYPEASLKKGIQGKVIVKFCITEKGDVNRVSIAKSLSSDIDEEATRVVKTIPSFKPGRQGGVAVPVWYFVPITFTLK
jgi:TonB family protein